MDQSVIIIIGTLVFITLISAFLMIFFIYQKRILKESNINQSLKLDLHERVLASIIDIQDIERKRLSEDLHDEMGAIIMALNLNNHQLLKDCKDCHKEYHKRLLKNDMLIELVGNKIRNMSHQLLPPPLKNGHLELALETLCDLFKEHSGIDISFKNEIKSSKIRNQDQLALYRVVNEWITNIIKHSGAKSIMIEFSQNRASYSLLIKDDGNGFNYEKSIKISKGLGLISMKGRLMKINAKFEFTNNVPKGTIFEIIYPCTI